MFIRKIKNWLGFTFLALSYSACVPTLVSRTPAKILPTTFTAQKDSVSTATINWKQYFTDPNLVALIDTALHNNQELNITLQELEISRNEIRTRKGEYLPSVSLRAGGGVDKVSRYTNIGAMEATTEIEPGKEMPEPVTDMFVGAYANWEVDIWHKLRNAKKAAVNRYLASIEGRNFMITNLIAEISNSYYELLALDNQLEIVRQNIGIQTNALEVVRYQKQAAKVNELAVRRFEAEVLKTQSLQYDIQQQIVETENRINFLVGRYPQPIVRNASAFSSLSPAALKTGAPLQLLENRPDIKQAELELAAADLDVKVARANFYPSLGINAAVGLRGLNPGYFVKAPESLLYSLAGDLAAPLVNRNGIKATYYSANAKQIQAVYKYEQTVLKAFLEVINQQNRIENLGKSYDLKSQQVQALTESITISNDLFRSARADYMEVLLTQREALESKFELIETKMQQLNASVNMYQALGGGWK
ncbi:TolC family protein [Adhaeribacter terreus]|uniref:TolC family protein n=1 Tax=Adhaeribacter terreus TaxID=529703 RepID=A0ABW0E6J1_9BACT